MDKKINDNFEFSNDSQLPISELVYSQDRINHDLFASVDDRINPSKPFLVLSDIDRSDSQAELSRHIDSLIFADQLRSLNPEIRIAHETDENGPYIMSSVDADELLLPLGYKDDDGILANKYSSNRSRYKNHRISVNKSSLVDNFITDNPLVTEDYYSEMLDNSHNPTAFEGEILKTNEQAKLIDNLIDIVNDERVEKGKKKIFIDHRMFRFFDKEAIQRERPGATAIYDPESQITCIAAPPTDSKLYILTKVAHELAHMLEYNEHIYNSKENSTYCIKAGYWNFNGEKKQSTIREVIAQERARHFINLALEKDKSYADELAEFNEYKANNLFMKYGTIFKNGKLDFGKKVFTEDGALGIYKKQDKSFGMLGDEYRKDRGIFKKYVNKISKYSGISKDEIYEMHFDAAEKGDDNLIEKLVDKTFGKGVYKKIETSDTDVNKLKKCVDRLEITKRIDNVKKMAKSVISRLFKTDFDAVVS